MSCSKTGLVLAGLYVAGAGWVVWTERVSTGGGWINLRFMGSYLATFPVAGLAEWLGMKLDFRRTVDVAVALGACVALVYLMGWGVERLFRGR
jgi:hypothetical protein